VITLSTVDSPIGPLTIAVRGARLCVLHFGADQASVRASLARWYPGETPADAANPRVGDALQAYFNGRLEALDAVDVELNGTPFQVRVWEALRSIPAGSTTSYGALARRIGTPQAVRAVGAANGANPVAVVVPCHRVIGSNGSLTGYGGGLDRKRWLLRHEGFSLF
jgi:methylated-DNA-[protein]-cysteine S-methyltransferase